MSLGVVSLGRRAVLRAGMAAKRYKPYRYYRTFRANERISREEVLEVQNQLIQRMIFHSYLHVPYYRDVFQSRGLTPADIKTAADLPKLPILTKEIIRREGPRMLAANIPASQRVRGATSGSTGQPMSHWKQREMASVTLGGLWRYYARCGWQPGDTIAMLWGFSESDWAMPRWKMRLREFLSRTCRLNPCDLGLDMLDVGIRRLQQARPKILVGYPSAMAVAAKRLQTLGQRIDGLAGVYSSAETLYPEQRALIEERFACPVFDFYGCSEVVHVAGECTQRAMHINPDCAVVEYGDPVDGHERPLILTGLHNLAMPFIRYENGDLCADEAPPCSCPLPFPTMSLAVARTTDMFRFANGRVVHGSYFSKTLFGADGVQSFQYHQTVEDAIVLRVVRGTGYGARDEALIEKAKRLVDEHSQGTTRIDVRFVDSIPASRLGKHRFTRSDVSVLT